jgi:putative selenate reductase molybdopterin-binding subunit
MADKSVEAKLNVNGEEKVFSVTGGETLLDALRRYGYVSVKRGCATGDCGSCTVLMDGEPVRSCMLPAVQVEGHAIETVEGMSAEGELHPLQEAFVEAGAIQCGFCTPGQLMVAKALLEENPAPTEAEIREAMNGVLCRCTGYVRIVDAVQQAAAVMRGEEKQFERVVRLPLQEDVKKLGLPEAAYRKGEDRDPLPVVVLTPPEMPKTERVGAPQTKVDGVKLVRGRAVFTDDVPLEGMLHAALLTSPHANARIVRIDASKARALPGVHAVLTHEDIPRIKHATGGQSYPNLPPYDQVCLDDRVRFVGDRVAVVAAETQQIANKALRLIEVEYEVLPPVLDMEEAVRDGAPMVHDEDDTGGIYDAKHNIVHHIAKEVGDVDAAMAAADHVFEGEYYTPKQQHAHIEPHVCITYWDEDDRLVIRTSTQVPFHIRRMVAPLIGLPVKQIRVVKPRIGGGFGNKQEMLVEDLAAHLTLATGRPVRFEYTRRQEFTSSRSRHPMIMRYKVGIKDNKMVAAELRLIGDTGAYGTHALTVTMVGGFKGLTLYNPPNARFLCDSVYTNTPPTGAYRGYGAMQCQFGMEVLMEEIAEKLGLDVVQFKRDNWLKLGEPMHLATKLGEGREGFEQSMKTSGMAQCVDVGLEVTDFYAKRETYAKQEGRLRRGIGMSVMIHGSGIAGLDMAAATLKMNDDGSFNLLMGATDIGTGSDTILAQMAAEVLGIPVEDLIVYSSDTDFTPFDVGAYASSTTYISGGAVVKAAQEIKRQVQEHAALILGYDAPEKMELRDRQVFTPDGRSVTLEEVALSSLHQDNQHQIMATASHISYDSPPPTAAQFAEVTVDTETGQVTVDRLLMVADPGRVINPITAAGQVEGGLSHALGFAHCEEMLFGEDGQMLNPRLGPYRIYSSAESPMMDVIFVETDEPTGPFGAKSVSELSMDGVAPAMASAIHNATGVWMRKLPYTPETVWRALRAAE